MKIIKQTQDYSRYDLETDPPTMVVVVSKEGIITLEQSNNYITLVTHELKELYHAINNKRI